MFYTYERERFVRISKGDSCSLLARYALPLAYVKPEVTWTLPTPSSFNLLLLLLITILPFFSSSLSSNPSSLSSSSPPPRLRLWPSTGEGWRFWQPWNCASCPCFVATGWLEAHHHHIESSSSNQMIIILNHNHQIRIVVFHSLLNSHWSEVPCWTTGERKFEQTNLKKYKIKVWRKIQKFNDTGIMIHYSWYLFIIHDQLTDNRYIGTANLEYQEYFDQE